MGQGRDSEAHTCRTDAQGCISNSEARQGSTGLVQLLGPLGDRQGLEGQSEIDPLHLGHNISYLDDQTHTLNIHALM